MVKGRNATEVIVVFNRNVKASELNKVVNGFHGKVVVTKKLIVDKALDIECDLDVLGDVMRKSPISEYPIKVNGDFSCYGDMHCNTIYVGGSFSCEGIIYSKSITVCEDFVCYDKVDAYGSNITVAGDFEAFAVKADSIIVMNSISVYGSISARCVKAG